MEASLSRFRNRRLWLAEGLFILIALIAAFCITYPIMGKVSTKWIVVNVLAIVYSLMIVKWIFFLEDSPIIKPIWAKGVLAISLIFIFLFFLTRFQSAQVSFADGVLKSFGGQDIDETKDGISTFTYTFFHKELLFFLFTSLSLSILMELRILRYLFKNSYKLWKNN